MLLLIKVLTEKYCNLLNVLFFNNNYTKTIVKHSYVILYLVNKINNI